MNGIYYDILSSTSLDVSVTHNGGPNSYWGSVSIPMIVRYSGVSYRVAAIDCGAFNLCTNLLSVTLPASVTSIEDGTFYGCTGLTDIVIPSSVTTIGDQAFLDCSSLKTLNIPSSVTYIGGKAFHNTAWLNNQPQGMVYLNKVAYFYKGIMPANTVVTLVDGTTAISGFAFSGSTNLTGITIPSSVTCIESNAFNGCSGLTGINIPSTVTSIEAEAFYGCSGLTSISIPPSISFIDEGVFCACSHLTNITIPSSVTSIGLAAFAGCSSLTNVTIPPSVTSIGDNAFCNCTGLKSAAIPSSVSFIGGKAFLGCNSLTRVVIPSSVRSIGSSAFNNCAADITVDAENKNYSSKDGALYNKTFTVLYQCPVGKSGEFSIPSTVTSIAGGAFESCSSLSGVTIPSSVTSLEDRVFYGCTGFKNVTIPSSVTYIRNYAFYGCTNLVSINIPSAIVAIGDHAFQNCTGIKSIMSYLISPKGLSNDVFTNIDKTNCKLSIPFGTTSLYKTALGWSDFSNVIEAFISIGTSITIDGITYTGNGINTLTITGNTTPTATTIPEGINYSGNDYKITSIGASSLEYCSNFTNVNIPSEVISIGGYAFNSCNKLSRIQFPSGLQTIEKYAFYNCTTLSEIIVNSPIPPVLGTDVFCLLDKTKCILRVPSTSLSLYKSAVQWKDFTNVIGTVTALSSIYNESFSLYLNPLDNTVCVNGIDGVCTLKLFDINGRLLLNKQVVNNEPLSANTLPKGMYIVKLITTEATAERKIILK